MQVLIDTGILLRVFDRSFPAQKEIFSALRKLWSEQHELVTTAQNIAEFWNVCTRPANARGGYGLPVALTNARVQVIERLGGILHFTPYAYAIWRDLLLMHQIVGVSVHDARIVAVMQAHRITHLLTLNGADFQRYPGLTLLTPEIVLQS